MDIDFVYLVFARLARMLCVLLLKGASCPHAVRVGAMCGGQGTRRIRTPVFLEGRIQICLGSDPDLCFFFFGVKSGSNPRPKLLRVGSGSVFLRVGAGSGFS